MSIAVRHSVKRAVWCCTMLGAAFSAVLNAQEQRWFEVEMLVFRQTPAPALQEQFGDVVTAIKPGRAFDLLTPRYQPELSALLSALPLCQQPALPLSGYQFNFMMPRSLCIVEQQPESWQQHSVFEPRRIINKVAYPAQIGYLFSGDGKHQPTPYLAEQSALQLTDVADKIKRQQGTTLLLHTAWRQAPVTERRAIASRWFAGQNFSQQFDYWGQPYNATSTVPGAKNTVPAPLADQSSEQNELIGSIELLLQQLTANSQLPDSSVALDSSSGDSMLTPSQLPDQVWQLDGLFKLHLDHYLFVNTEFNLRLPEQGQLNTVYVRQSRRVVSGEVHYLDHPHLGIVLQIRRFDPPLAEPASEVDEKVTTE